ncbi:MAG: E3 binding domain-containing protein, partial [Actinomycetota bacterium]|nr:E3 binding domain-containing protein [Actinomycetota bacterium]
MAIDVTMPRLSDSMVEGTIIRWLKSDGDDVARGEEIAEIETDKATMTYEADADGTLAIVAQEGDTLPVGDVIARLGGADAEDAAQGVEVSTGANVQRDEGAESTSTGDTTLPDRESTGVATEAPAAPRPAPAPGPGRDGDGDGERGENGRTKASPVARRMARELGVELRDLRGSGPEGRIVKADVQAATGDGDGAAQEPAVAGAPE